MSGYESDASVNRYIERIRKIPQLSREDEHDLAVASAAGDENARQKLIEANLRFVVAVALQYRRYGIRISDLIAEGNLGLVIASRKFDADKGTRFVTYAGYWIRALVLDLVVKSSTMVGAGSGPLRSKIFFRLRRERARLSNTTPDYQERLEKLANMFEMPTARMEEMLKRLDARDVYLDAPAHDDSQGSLLDAMPDERQRPDTQVADTDSASRRSTALQEALKGLDRRERFVLERRYMQDEEESLASIGRELGVSRERARQLEARAKEKLRRRLSEVELDMVA